MHFTRIKSLTLALGVLAAVPTVGMAAQGAGASGSSSSQVAQGVALYNQRCGACHNVPSRSIDDAPLLVGPDFEHKWKARPQALFKKIRFSMPQNNPGTLTDDETKALMAALSSGQISGKAPKK